MIIVLGVILSKGWPNVSMHSHIPSQIYCLYTTLGLGTWGLFRPCTYNSFVTCVYCLWDNLVNGDDWFLRSLDSAQSGATVQNIWLFVLFLAKGRLPQGVGVLCSLLTKPSQPNHRFCRSRQASQGKPFIQTPKKREEPVVSIHTVRY